MSILEEIFAHKRVELARERQVVPLAVMQDKAAGWPAPVDFVAALRASPAKPALIAEVKRASPSRGALAADADPLQLAEIYQRNGAAAVSVLTDEQYFNGHLDHLRRIAERHPGLPLLRKDFTLDPYQLHQARAAGAAALLLIASTLPMTLLAELHDLCRQLRMAALVEVHTAEDLDLALRCQPALIGINNRDLTDFSVDLNTTVELLPLIPSGICVVSESGIRTRDDVARLGDLGVDAILVGEALATAAGPAAKARELSGMTQRRADEALGVIRD